MKENDIFPFEEDDIEDSGITDIDFICTRDVDKEQVEVLFVDFKYDVVDDEPVGYDNLTGEEPTISNVIGPDIFSQKINIDNDYNDDKQIKNEFVNMVSKLTEVNCQEDPELYEKFNFTYETELDDAKNQRRLISKIFNASNLIAASGRIGPAQYMILSKENYKKYNLEIMESTIEPIFHDIDNILLFRRNSIDQPGIIYLKNNISNKYAILSIGFYPQKQYIKINLTHED